MIRPILMGLIRYRPFVIFVWKMCMGRMNEPELGKNAFFIEQTSTPARIEITVGQAFLPARFNADS